MSHERYINCINACYDCTASCRECRDSCLKDQDIKVLTRCIKLLSECASVCNLTAIMMATGSEYINEFCQLCSFICDDCASECKKHQQTESCRICAEACQKCADECREVIKMSKVQIAY